MRTVTALEESELREPRLPAGGPMDLLSDFATLRALLDAQLQRVADEARGAASAADAPDDGGAAGGGAQQLERVTLDAFLMAAGLNQILEDYLHRDAYALNKVAKHVRQVKGRYGRVAARTAAGAAVGLQRLRAAREVELRLVSAQAAIAALVDGLADVVAERYATWGRASLGGDSRGPDELERLAQAGRAELKLLTSVSERLEQEILRLPSCFRSFDQHPLDCERLVERYVERWPDRATPALVIGLRTSGSYLAPLCAAYLRREGYRQARAMTLRPGQRLMPHEQAAVLALAQRRGRMLLVDDPPSTGSAYIETAHTLERAGIHRQDITCLVPLLGAAQTPPAVLSGYDMVVLGWREWSIHERLAPEHIQGLLNGLLVGSTLRVRAAGDGQTTAIRVADVREVRRLPLSLPVDDPKAVLCLRGHARALYEVRLVDAATGEHYDHRVYAKATGLGYFGEHALTVAQRLSAFVPQTYGRADGILFRAWLPEASRLSSMLDGHAETETDVSALADRLVEYVVARRAALGVERDVSLRLAGRNPLWQRASDALGHSFGRAAPLVRPALHRMAQTLLLREVTTPAIVDGGMTPANWFVAPGFGERTYTKVDGDEYAFSNYDTYSYDVVADLAAAAAYFELYTERQGRQGAAIERWVRERYTALTGEAISDERWLLYQLGQLVTDQYLLAWSLPRLREQQEWTRWREMREGPGGVAEDAAADVPENNAETFARALATVEAMERECARIHQRYIGSRYFADVAPAHAGRLCAIDIDGVLETRQMSYVAISPAGALALRALSRHGYRPVLATGRSIGEVHERCEAYHLAGGVAEYGAVAYDHLTGRTLVLLREDELDTLSRLRAALAEIEGVYLDDAYAYAVRAYRFDASGKHRGLDDDMIARALARIAEGDAGNTGNAEVAVIGGMRQTDFMVCRVNKASGLHALAMLLEGGSAAEADKSAEQALLAMAAGDTVHDLPMLALAERAYAPCNADGELHAAFRANPARPQIMKGFFGSGLLEAVGSFLGHDPRRCARCRPPSGSQGAQLVLTTLAALDEPAAGKLRVGIVLAGRVAGLGTRVRRTSRSPQN